MKEKSRWKGLKSTGMVCKTTKDGEKKRDGKKILYQQSGRRYRFIQQGSAGALGRRDHALAAGCNIP